MNNSLIIRRAPLLRDDCKKISLEEFKYYIQKIESITWAEWEENIGKLQGLIIEGLKEKLLVYEFNNGIVVHHDGNQEAFQLLNSLASSIDAYIILV